MKQPLRENIAQKTSLDNRGHIQKKLVKKRRRIDGKRKSSQSL